MEIRISTDKKVVSEIRGKIAKNREMYGRNFCPSVSPELYKANSNEHVCICKDFLSMEEGKCKCGLYTKFKY